MTTTLMFPATPLGKAAAAIIGPIIVAFSIGAFTLIWQMDKQIEKLADRFIQLRASHFTDEST